MPRRVGILAALLIALLMSGTILSQTAPVGMGGQRWSIDRLVLRSRIGLRLGHSIPGDLQRCFMAR